jgi:DNA-directed RNA polymerase sigma subunit (sigma70/sigma32)
VSRQLGVTPNRVRRAERRALERLRAACPQGERERLAG